MSSSRGNPYYFHFHMEAFDLCRELGYPIIYEIISTPHRQHKAFPSGVAMTAMDLNSPFKVVGDDD